MFIDTVTRRPPSVRRAKFIDAVTRRPPPSVRRAMFIDAVTRRPALRQEGHVLTL